MNPTAPKTIPLAEVSTPANDLAAKIAAKLLIHPDKMWDKARADFASVIAAELAPTLDALSKDAERYDFLRRFDHFRQVDDMLNEEAYSTLDAAVDAARQKLPEKQP